MDTDRMILTLSDTSAFFPQVLLQFCAMLTMNLALALLPTIQSLRLHCRRIYGCHVDPLYTLRFGSPDCHLIEEDAASRHPVISARCDACVVRASMSSYEHIGTEPRN